MCKYICAPPPPPQLPPPRTHAHVCALTLTWSAGGGA